MLQEKMDFLSNQQYSIIESNKVDEIKIKKKEKIKNLKREVENLKNNLQTQNLEMIKI